MRHHSSQTLADIHCSDLLLFERKFGKMVLNIIQSTTSSVSTSLEIDHSYHFVENVSDAKSPNLAELYKPWKGCLAIKDHCV